jgi:hypothetical protein
MAEWRLPEREWAMEHWISHVRQAVHFSGSRATFFIRFFPLHRRNRWAGREDA